MSDFGVSAIFAILSAVKESIDCMVENREFAAKLKTRLDALQEPIEKLSQTCATNKAAIDNLMKNLEELNDFVKKLAKKSAFRRFFSSGSDQSSLEEFDTRINSCVMDLNLLISINIESRLSRLVSIEEKKRNPAVDRVLTSEGARDFYQRYFNGNTTQQWNVFWINFSLELEQLDITPDHGLELEVRRLCDSNEDGLVTPKELNGFFTVWEDPLKKKQLIKQAAKDVKLTQYLDAFTVPYTRDLQLKVIGVNPLLANEFRVNDVFFIKPTGILNSRRYKGDRTVRIGRFDGNRNDININPEDIEVSRDMFQIICNTDGYYILDSANIGATSLKVRPGTSKQLSKGSLFNVGKNIVIKVAECTDFDSEGNSTEGNSTSGSTSSRNSIGEPYLKLEVFKGDGTGKFYEFTSSGRTSEFIIGHKAPGPPKAVEFNDPQVSRMHAKIVFTFNGWHLTDLNSKNGTWMLLINFDSVRKNMVSPPIKLTNGDVIGASSYFFECLC